MAALAIYAASYRFDLHHVHARQSLARKIYFLSRSLSAVYVIHEITYVTYDVTAFDFYVWRLNLYLHAYTRVCVWTVFCPRCSHARRYWAHGVKTEKKSLHKQETSSVAVPRGTSLYTLYYLEGTGENIHEWVERLEESQVDMQMPAASYIRVSAKGGVNELVGNAYVRFFGIYRHVPCWLERLTHFGKVDFQMDEC